MIDSIEAIENLGRFDKFSWDKDALRFSKFNLILGYNGSGKSTLSNVLRLYSDRETDGGDSLFRSLSAGRSNPVVSVRIDDRKITFKSSCPKQSIYVFNSDFTTEHVYQGTNFTFKPFDSSVITNDQLKNPKIADLESRIADIQAGLDKKNVEKSKIETRFDEIKKAMSKELNIRIKGSRMPSFSISGSVEHPNYQSIRTQLDKAFSDYDLSQKQVQLNQDIEQLHALEFNELKIKPAEVAETLVRRVSRAARAKVEEKLGLLSGCEPEHATLVDWFEDGFGLLKYAKGKGICICPLCGSDIAKILPILIAEYDAYFNEEYRDLTNTLNNLSKNLQLDFESIQENGKSVLLLKTLETRYVAILDTKPTSVKLDCQKVLQTLEKIIGLVGKKKEKIELENLAIEQETLGIIDDYNSSIQQAVNACSQLSKILESCKIDPEKITATVKELIPKCCNAETNEIFEGNQLVKMTNLVKKIQESETTLKETMAKRSKEVASLRKESQYVNAYLHKLGISHFQISIQKTDDSETINVDFAGGQTRSELKHSLSEGEKTALSFAYFLSKLQYEVNDNSKTKMSDVIVVIDDPVSSLDEERLHSTACLIQAQLNDCCQLFVLSHNMAFMRFFSNVIGNPKEEISGKQVPSRRDYYLCNHDGCLQNLPSQLRNYSTSYFQRLNDILRFNAGELDYEIAKTFMPSYIRIVLESFFSFKLSMLSQGSSGDKYLSPGLDRIIRHIKGDIGLFSNFKKVGAVDSSTLVDILSSIRRITDPQVHGTPNDVMDVRFVSEAELRSISRNASDVISFIDDIHLARTTIKNVS